MYSVRVLYYVRVSSSSNRKSLIEDVFTFSSYDEAKDRFIFYVYCALEMNLDLRACNILKGRKSIKFFKNY